MRWFAEWLDTHAWSTALHESLFLYPWIESTHVLSLMLFVGTIFIVDFRLLGIAFRDVPVSQVTSRILPWTVFGFVVSVATGLLLFYAIPIRTYHSIWFRIKVVLLVVAAINAWVFHRRVSRRRTYWDSDAKPPVAVRLTALTSVLTWCGVIICGRMIAYNWFDCYKQLPGWLLFLTECAQDPSSP